VVYTTAGIIQEDAPLTLQDIGTAAAAAAAGVGMDSSATTAATLMRELGAEVNELEMLHAAAAAENEVKQRTVLQRAMTGEMTVAAVAKLLKAYVDRGAKNVKMSFRHGPRRGGGSAQDEARIALVEAVKEGRVTIEQGIVQLQQIDAKVISKKMVRFLMLDDNATIKEVEWEAWSPSVSLPPTAPPPPTYTLSPPSPYPLSSMSWPSVCVCARSSRGKGRQPPTLPFIFHPPH
jgi:hypothetical protein